MNQSTEIIRSNCPRDCYDGCGILIEKIDGKINRVLGDPDHPVSRGRLCNKCATAYNGVWQDENYRLLSPLKRTGEKASGSFTEISWDEALAIIAERLNSDIREHGAQSIIHTHYSGTLSLVALEFPMRFFNFIGASEVVPDSICNLAGHIAWGLLYGESAMGFDPRTAKDTNCILVWGANPSHSGPHTHKNWLTELDAPFIVVDPIKTITAQAADIHLQPFPGTDAALAFSILNVLKCEGHFDDTFIDKYTLGAEEIFPTISACTPEWGEQQTGVPATLIREAAALYGKGPSMLWAGQAVQRQTTGGNIMRAIGLLPAMTGNIGKPGAGFCYLNMTPALAGMDFEKMEAAAIKKAGGEEVSHMDFAEELSNPDKFKSLVSWNTNPVASAPNQHRLRQALKREDLFTVVIDCFQTDTADYADIILPAASFLEFDDLTFSYFHLHIGVQSKASEPMGESLPNQEIFRRLAEKMDLKQTQLFEKDEELISGLLGEMGVDESFTEFQQKGWQLINDEVQVFYEDLKFPTESGKIEIASAAAVEMGAPLTPQPWADKKPRQGKLRLITPASDFRMNDSYANDPRLAERAGQPEVILHSEDAQAMNIKSGDRVRLNNESGELELTARIDNIAPPGVAVSYKGRWPKLESDRKNLNVLHTGTSADMGGSTSVHSTEVEISPT